MTLDHYRSRFLDIVITGNESWLNGYRQKQKHCQFNGRILRPQSRKNVLGVNKNQGDAGFFDVCGVVHHEYAQEGQLVKKE